MVFSLVVLSLWSGVHGAGIYLCGVEVNCFDEPKVKVLDRGKRVQHPAVVFNDEIIAQTARMYAPQVASSKQREQDVSSACTRAYA